MGSTPWSVSSSLAEPQTDPLAGGAQHGRAGPFDAVFPFHAGQQRALPFLEEARLSHAPALTAPGGLRPVLPSDLLFPLPPIQDAEASRSPRAARHGSVVFLVRPPSLQTRGKCCRNFL